MKLISTQAAALSLVLALGVGAAGCAATSTKESTGQYIDDATLTTKVKAALVADKQVSALDVNVETFKGVVQLSGFADSQSEISHASSVAKSVKGVKSVKNDLRLKAAT